MNLKHFSRTFTKELAKEMSVVWDTKSTNMHRDGLILVRSNKLIHQYFSDLTKIVSPKSEWFFSLGTFSIHNFAVFKVLKGCWIWAVAPLACGFSQMSKAQKRPIQNLGCGRTLFLAFRRIWEICTDLTNVAPLFLYFLIKSVIFHPFLIWFHVVL